MEARGHGRENQRLRLTNEWGGLLDPRDLIGFMGARPLTGKSSPASSRFSSPATL